MKRIIAHLLPLVLLVGFFLPVTSVARAETVTQIAVMEAGVTEIFSLEMYTDENVLFTTDIPFLNLDPANSFCYPNGRAQGDGKSDIGLVCTSNVTGVPSWYCKMQATATSTPAFPLAYFKFYMSKPWNRNLGTQADGLVTFQDKWTAVPTVSTVIYTSGAGDTINTPYGTLATMSFAVNPQTLSAKVQYSIRIDYTLTTTP